VTGGQDTVALRVPAHPLTLAVLQEFGGGVAAPSANRFGRVSPTTVAHVLDELGDALVAGRDVVLDGGPAGIGVESTIVDATAAAPVLLRPGAITAADVARLGGVPLGAQRSPVRAPGGLAAHYAPRARVQVVAASALAGRGHDAGAAAAEATVGLLADAAIATPAGLVRLAAPSGTAAYAAALYAALREADQLGLSLVLAVPPPGPGLALAVRDRLARAAVGSAAGPGVDGPP
jgi:L-threonylcarbamoyladenylate synthase